MVNTVLNSISKALYTTFGDNYHYYVEDVEQSVKLPCFTLGVLNPISRSINKTDYLRTIPCVIHYFTNDKKDAVKNCYSISEKVLECLEYLEVNGRLIRAESMNYMMVDDVLQIFLTYQFWTETVREVRTDMEDLAEVKSSTT